MNWSKWTCQIHRWLSMAFTVGVIINSAALAGGKEPAFWVYLLALIPLALLLLSGLYLFVLPYTARGRGGRHADG